MKIRSICPHTNHLRISECVRRLFVAAGVALLGTIACAPVHAQTGPIGQAIDGHITHGNEAFRIVSASDVPADEAATGTIQQVGCQSCGTSCGGSCGVIMSDCGSCGSCGSACGGSCGNCYRAPRRGNACTPRGYGYSPFSGYGHPCAPCAPYYYVNFDALYMQRDTNERFSLSQDYQLGDYSQEMGGRFTLGTVPDCVHGYELSYTGHFQWDRAAAAFDPGGGLDSILQAGTPLAPAAVSAFDNPVTASAQLYTNEYWSIEGNRTMTGWDVARLLVGVRYLEWDERYAFFSTDGVDNGFFGSRTDNKLFGIQAGLDLMYPISRNGYTDFRSRAGGFINFAESDVLLINAGTVHINNGDDRRRVAGVFELGAGLRYYFGQTLAIRGGVELWYLSGIAKANNQFTNVVSPTVTGRRTFAKSDVLVTGLTFGAELRL